MDNQTIPIQTPQQPSSKSKLLIILFAITLLFFFGFGGIFIGKYYLSNQTKITPSISPTITSESIVIPTSTSDINKTWKTYVNTKYGYSLKYPSDWTVNLGVTGYIGDDSNLETVYQIKLNSQNIPEEKLMIWVWVKKSFSKNIDELSSSIEISKPNSEKMQIYFKEKALLGGIEALRYVRSQPGVGKVLNVTTIKNNYEYTLNLNNPDTQPQNILTFDQIISTFKFAQ